MDYGLFEAFHPGSKFHFFPLLAPVCSLSICLRVISSRLTQPWFLQPQIVYQYAVGVQVKTVVSKLCWWALKIR